MTTEAGAVTAADPFVDLCAANRRRRPFGLRTLEYSDADLAAARREASALGLAITLARHAERLEPPLDDIARHLAAAILDGRPATSDPKGRRAA